MPLRKCAICGESHEGRHPAALMPLRKCAICGESLEGRHPAAKTCSRSCQQKLARRNKNAEQRRARSRKATKRNGLQAIAEAVGGGNDTLSIAEEVLREELREHISRAALTEDVVADIKNMVKFAPAAIQVLTIQLTSDDETVAQRAAALILKYTMGNPSVAPAPTEQVPQPMQVLFALPERGAPQPAEIEGEAAVLRACNDCGQPKAPEEFVGNSDRCKTCFDRLQLDVRTKFA
jgi:predicted nucleic acid-binding Zn ribbon protein